MIKSLARRNDKPFTSWQRQMDNFFNRFNRELDFSDTNLDFYSPRVEVQEKGKNYLVKAEVPGMSENDITVSLRDNQLILEGERKSESEKEEKEGYFSEFSYGSFYRAIPLDDEVNPDKVTASYKDGIVTVELEKVKEITHTEKKIPILKH